MKNMFKTRIQRMAAIGALTLVSPALWAAGYYAPAYGYAQAPYGYGQGYPGYTYNTPYYAPGYGASPYYGYGYPGGSPYANGGGFSNAPWNRFKGPDIFGPNSPFQDPLQNEGHWAKKGFRPWRSGPFAYDKWKDHPATKMPWGNFPGWGKGFFGGYGPDNWEGATPWGNDVPFKWLDPTDPEESIANMWEDAINTPNKMGRMPPGFTAPYISVPNPIDVENEFERNARNAPHEIHNMWGGEGGGFGADQSKDKKKKAQKNDKDGKAKADAKGKDGKPAKAQAAARGDGWGWKDDWWNKNARK